MRCIEDGCRFEAKTASGLAAHMRQKHGTAAGANRRAAEKTLSILRGLGRIEDIDAARVQTIRSLADALDRDDGNAQMWRTYREAIEDLMRQDDDADDELAQALAEIRGTPTVGD
jgi:hypothetical protein